MESLRPKLEQIVNIKGRKGLGAIALSLGLLGAGCSMDQPGIETCPEGQQKIEVDLEASYHDADALDNPSNIIEALKQKYGHEITRDHHKTMPEEAKKNHGSLSGNPHWPDWKEGQDLLCLTEDEELSLDRSGAQLKAEAEAYLNR